MKSYFKSVALGILLGLVFGMLLGSVRGANARDVGQWQNSDPAIHEWYRTLERPDAPGSICCTEADSYWADEVHVRDGKTYAVVTDDRPDGPLGRPHVPSGTEFEVPPEKLKYDKGNPTGHGVLFVSTSGYTWCYVQATGI
ncbi:hypothetical protein SAMN05444159_1241 [Bradyrhizobium lablabi]|uniref:Uncharacterized protein n=1 Tax=Bradyrhizobium lablabi TaxID=722472 RepID=A0A1M6LCS2_9BRAD|nr:hypothetical protein [Bradyrhizobium lablabi]SHJ69030.1 hypothetical protein SAMN05444159_1241 [Bradyrhizobium lablabi]